MANYIEGKLHFVSDANQSMYGRSCFDFEVAAIDAEFSLRPKFVPTDCYLCRNRDLPRYPVQLQIAGNLQVVLITARCLAGNVRALNNNFRISIGQMGNCCCFLKLKHLLTAWRTIAFGYYLF